MANYRMELSEDEYDILSIHSSDNDLGDETGGEGTFNNDNHAPHEDLLSRIDDLESNGGGVNTDTELEDSLSRSEPFVVQQPGATTQPNLTFPGSSFKDIVAPLDEGLNAEELSTLKDSSSTGPKLSFNGGRKQSKVGIYFDEFIADFAKKTVLCNSVRYVVMSGSSRPYVKPFISDFRDRFPALEIIWIDLDKRTLEWVTEGQKSLPCPEKLRKEAIRMDFYNAERMNHVPVVLKHIDEHLLPGFLKLGNLPISPRPSWVWRDPPFPLNKMNVKPSPRPLIKDLDDITLTHLSCVVNNPEYFVFDKITERHVAGSPDKSSFNKRAWALLALTAVLVFIKFMPSLGIIMPSISELTAPSPNDTPIPMTDAVQNSPYAPSKYFWDFFKSARSYFPENGVEKITHSLTPSTVYAQPIEIIEERFREAAIQFVKLLHQVQSAAQDFYVYVKDFSQEQINSSPFIHAAKSRAAEQWNQHMGKYYSDFIRPQWLRGREQAAQWMN